MASCGHGVIQWSVNMYEIFGEVNMLSEEILRLKAVYDEALTYLRYFCETPIFSESQLDVDESDDYDSDTDSENDDAVQDVV